MVQTRKRFQVSTFENQVISKTKENFYIQELNNMQNVIRHYFKETYGFLEFA